MCNKLMMRGGPIDHVVDGVGDTKGTSMGWKQRPKTRMAEGELRYNRDVMINHIVGSC